MERVSLGGASFDFDELVADRGRRRGGGKKMMTDEEASFV